MGRHKKTVKITEPKTAKVAEPKKECKKKKGVKVVTQSTKYFRNQIEAREYAIKLLEAGLTFLDIDEYNIDEKDC